MAKYIKGAERGQMVLFPESIEDYIGEKSEARIIDMFVESLELKEIGFKESPNDKGTNHYDPKDMLKLYLYGYRNGIRSSRKLAKECERNIEVMWLIRGIKPNYRTINSFRKHNKKNFKKVFARTVQLAEELKVVGREWSQDGVKIRAVNSKERNYTLNKIDDRIKRVQAKVDEYIKEMDKQDEEEAKEERERARNQMSRAEQLAYAKERMQEMIEEEKEQEKIKKKIEEEEKLRKMRADMEERGESQISLTDEESRLMKDKGDYQVCYNTQVLVDGASHLVINYEADNNGADVGSIAKVTKEGKEIVGEEGVVRNILDKGYNDRKDMEECIRNGIQAEVTLNKEQKSYELEYEYEEAEISKEMEESEKAEDIEKVIKAGKIPKVLEGYIKKIEVKEKKRYEEIDREVAEEMSEGELQSFAMENTCFMRDEKRERVYCPMGEILRVKSESRNGKRYCNKEACKRCKNPCTMGKYKEIIMKEGAIISTTNKELRKRFKVKRKKVAKMEKKVLISVVPDEEAIKKRMGISEHSHGTMKRSDGFSYFLLKGKEGVNGELGIYYAARNLKRMMNLGKIEEMMKYMKERIEARG